MSILPCRVAVVGHPHAIWGETVVAHVVLLRGRAEETELIAFARKAGWYKLPETVFRIAEGPTGKIQQRALREEQRACGRCFYCLTVGMFKDSQKRRCLWQP
jgi:acyl-CoA synthetase (AMP-forming)/AMP-acid ligase II